MTFTIGSLSVFPVGVRSTVTEAIRIVTSSATCNVRLRRDCCKINTISEINHSLRVLKLLGNPKWNHGMVLKQVSKFGSDAIHAHADSRGPAHIVKIIGAKQCPRKTKTSLSRDYSKAKEASSPQS